MKSWNSYAREAGIRDTIQLTACAADTAIVRHIENGRSLGEKIEVKATPTVIVNGWRVPSPTASELTRVVADLLAGKEPFSAPGGTVEKW